MVFKIYNTLTRKIEVFKPLDGKKVRMYTCGPTVYRRAHIGNIRAYISADVLRRTLEYKGYKLLHVMNITDVGHLTSDADTGEDKMEKSAREERMSAWVISKKYTELFFEDIATLNIQKPHIICKATDHISEQIALIKILEKKGYTYRTSDGIYFDTSKFPRYGDLAKLDISGLQAGARIEVGEKKNKTDFALWKFSKSGEKRDMEWISPWGKGFPGWHIECSAMSMKYLGENFDIHTGGIDHIPIHHTNEIAQSECATEKVPFVKYWIHSAFLNVDNEKMSKSLGNFYTVHDLIEKGHTPKAIRYLFISVNYRQPMNFTFESLTYAKNAVDRINTFYNSLERKSKKDSTKIPALINLLLGRFEEAMDNDLNISEALSEIFIFIRKVNKINLSETNIEKIREAFKKLDSILGILEEQFITPPGYIENLIKEREKARKEKDFKKADLIRSTIEEKGFILEDTDKGVKVKKK